MSFTHRRILWKLDHFEKVQNIWKVEIEQNSANSYEEIWQWSLDSDKAIQIARGTWLYSSWHRNEESPKKTPEERQASLQIEDPLPANKLDDQPTEMMMLIILDVKIL